MSESSERRELGRHRATIDGPVVPLEMTLSLAMVAAVITAGLAAMAAVGDWASFVVCAAGVVAALVIFGVCAWLEWSETAAPARSRSTSSQADAVGPARSRPTTGEPVGSRADWTLPGRDFYDALPDRPSAAPAVGLFVAAALVLGTTIAISVVTDGRPEWLLTGFACVAILLAGAGAREMFRLTVPESAQRATMVAMARPALLLVFFGGAGVFFFYVLMFDPSCSDCGTAASDRGAWALLVGCWVCGVVFALSAWRNRDREV